MLGIAEREAGIGIRIAPKVEQQGIHRSGMDGKQPLVERRTDTVRCVDRQATSAAHQGDAVATRSLVHIGRRDHDRDPLTTKAVQHIPELHAGNRVDARRRLVQEKDIGTMDQRTAQGQLLLHPAGEFSGPPLLERLDLDVDIAYQIIIFLDRRVEYGCKEIEVFLHRQILIE